MARVASAALTVLVVLLMAPRARAEEIFVAPGESVQAAIDRAMPGDVVTVRAGTYAEALQTVRDASAASPITVRGDPAGGEVVVTAASTVLRVAHAYVVVQGIVFDGQYAAADAVQIEDGGDFLVLRGVEVRRAGRDCIDVGAPEGVTIEGSRIHHCLWWSGVREDAHGIAGGAVRDFTIRGTEIHSFSGDAIQFDPGRELPGWDNIVIEGCHIWLEPLATAENGFAAGTVPGENAVDTKTEPSSTGHLTIRDTVAHGFGGGMISNMAAFNLKENVIASVERVTVYDSEIAFRLRGATSTVPVGARVTIANAVVYAVATAVRYEDDIEPVAMHNVTLGRDVVRAFDDQASAGATIDARNLLVLGASLPAEAMGVASNLAVGPEAFADVAGDSYRLAGGSPAIDVGETIASVTIDRDGVSRPQGAAYDVGAYELCVGECGLPPDAGPIAGRDGAIVGRDDAGVAPPVGEPDSGCTCRVARARDPRPARAALMAAALAVLLARRRRRQFTKEFTKGPRLTSSQ